MILDRLAGGLRRGGIAFERLPPIDRTLEPRLVVQLTQLDTGLSVLPTLVYGAPPSVRIVPAVSMASSLARATSIEAG